MSDIRETRIPGLFEIPLTVRRDERGSFTETFDIRRLSGVGINFTPVQTNRSVNEGIVTRGIHAEPWNKYVQLAFGQAFAAIVDLRPGDSFGVVETFDLDETNALFIPAGCGNSYQTGTLESSYIYQVDAHYDLSLAGKYPAVNIADTELGIPWPISIDQTRVSEKDITSGSLDDFRKFAAAVLSETIE